MEISEAITFARARRNGVLVTQKRDGRPQLSNIAYAVVDGVVKISITADRAKYWNLIRNPHASLYVTREDFWASVGGRHQAGRSGRRRARRVVQGRCRRAS